MRNSYKIIIAVVLLTSSLNALAAWRCVVADARGRTWAVQGPHACSKAVNRCRAWHLHRHGNVGVCNVIRRRG